MSNIKSSKFSLERLFCKVLFISCAAGALAMLAPLTANAETTENGSIQSTAAKNWLKPFEAMETQNADPTAFCRFGVNLNTYPRDDGVDKITSYDVASLGIGWYIDYQAAHSPVHPNNVDYTPMIRILPGAIVSGTQTYDYSPNGANLWIAITNNPGSDWFIGNEPDRKAFQDGAEPAVYATAYNELYYFIKDVDPTARIFAGSIVQPTEARLIYLDEVLASYQAQFGEPMPVDGWSIHNFILNEADCDAFDGDLNKCWGADMPPGSTETEGLRIDFTPQEIVQHHDINIFTAQVQNFRQWMADNGYGGMPVYLSEYGVLLPNIYAGIDFSPAVVNQFMTETFDYMLSATDPVLGDPNDGNKLIQRFSWYSVNDDRQNGGQYNGNLFNTTSFTESAMGQHYREYTESLQPEVNIYLADIAFTSPITTMPGTAQTTPITHTIRMTIASSGNLLEKSTQTIRLYDNAPANGGQQILPDFDVELAGCGEMIVIEQEIVIAPEDTTRFRRTVRHDDSNIYFPSINTYFPVINN